MSPPTNPLAYSPCQVPLRRAVVFGGVSITMHAGCYYDLLEADRRWVAAGGNKLYDIRQNDTGSYNCRPSVAHSRAVALDANWLGNPMTSKRTPCPQEVGMKEFYEICWEPLGYGSGMYWRSKCDAMHISLLKSEGGCGILWRKWGNDDQEDWFDMATKKELEDLLEEKLKPIREAVHIQIVKNGQKHQMGIDHVAKSEALEKGWLKPDGTWTGA